MSRTITVMSPVTFRPKKVSIPDGFEVYKKSADSLSSDLVFRGADGNLHRLNTAMCSFEPLPPLINPGPVRHQNKQNDKVTEMKDEQDVADQVYVGLSKAERVRMYNEIFKHLGEEQDRRLVQDLIRTWKARDDATLRLIHKLVCKSNEFMSATKKHIAEGERMVKKYEQAVSDRIEMAEKLAETIANHSKAETARAKQLTAAAERYNDLRVEKAELSDTLARLKYLLEMAKMARMNREDQESVMMDQESMADDVRIKECQTGTEMDLLYPGREVYVRVSGEGPFVLVEPVPNATIETLTPIGKKRESFIQQKIHTEAAWAVRGADGNFCCYPAAILTTKKPARRSRFTSLKTALVSEGMWRLAQMAGWGSLIYILAATR